MIGYTIFLIMGAMIGAMVGTYAFLERRVNKKDCLDDDNRRGDDGG